VRSRVTFAVVAVLVSGLLIVTTYRSESTDPEHQKPRHYKVAGFIAGAFALSLVAFAASQRIDGFSFGSIVLAVLLEIILFMGWANSPQDEPDRYFYLASALPFTLIVATLLFNALQKEA